MEFNEIMEACQVAALASKFEPTEDSVYRKFCRNYSKKFFTPLHEVMQLDPAHVVLTIYEEQLEEADLESIETVERLLDIIYSIEDPNYENNKEGDLKDFIEESELEENERLESKKSVTKALVEKMRKRKQEIQEATAPKEPPKELPKQGGINLAYLADSENEG